MFGPAQDSSVWLGLPSREQLMSPECKKHQVLSLAKMLVVNKQNTLFSSVFTISILQCSPVFSILRRCKRKFLYY